MVPAATGTDTAGSLRIPSALCATSTIKPTRGLVSTSGVVPLAPTLDHCGPMARSVVDCALLLEAMAGPDFADATTAFAALPGRPLHQPLPERPLVGVRLALSTRARARDGLDDDVSAGLARAVAACRELGATIVEPSSAPPAEPTTDQLALLCTEMLAFHRQFAGARDGYRTSTREFLEYGERIAVTGEGYVRIQEQRREATRTWWQWLDDENVAAIVEPTVPVVAPLRGNGYDAMGNDAALVSLTYLWNWTGFPVVSLPAGLGKPTRLPVGVSLIGRPGNDPALLAMGSALQQVLGVPVVSTASG
jgi:aspartyl-tRNA(Asn)/glutamyl-tRNA(Gln) amidotransferase subunit A